MSPQARRYLGLSTPAIAGVLTATIGLLLSGSGLGGHGIALGLMGLALDLVAAVWLVASEWPGVLPRVMYYLAGGAGITIGLAGQVAIALQEMPAAVAFAVLSWALFFLLMRLPWPH